MFATESLLLLLSAAYMVAGMIKDVAATAMSDDMVDATVSLNVLWPRRTPDAMKQQPSTSRILDKIEPSMLAWTIRISPLRSATMETCACKYPLPGQVHHPLATYNQLDSISERGVHQST